MNNSLNGTNSRIIDTRFRQMQSGGPSEKRSMASILRETTLALKKRIEHIIRSKQVVTSHTSSKAKTCSKLIETIRERSSMVSIKKLISRLIKLQNGSTREHMNQ